MRLRSLLHPLQARTEKRLWAEIPGPFHRTRSIFIHIPKAAGISVSTVLYGCLVGHTTIQQYYHDDRSATRSYFKFTFVREPLDRLLSAYSYLKKGGINAADKAFADEHLRDTDFAAFVRGLHEGNVPKDYILLQPQMSFIAKHNRILMNFIGRFETIEKDFAHVAETIGVKAELPHRNASEKADVAVDGETRRLVRAIYESDYEWLGY